MALIEPVHQRQQLRDDPLFDLARHAFALRRDRIDLVDKNYARSLACRILENLTQARFAFSVEFVNDCDR